MNAWFGTSWGAPICEITPQVPVPVGQKCLHCKEEIVATDNGIVTPYLGATGDSQANFHHECWFRLVVGSVGHLLKVCSCFNTGVDAYDDPPGVTDREAAQAALEMFREMRRQGTHDDTP